MDFLIELIQSYGYYIVFVGTLLEGETIVALAGFAAFQGHLDLRWIIPIAITGAVIGDQAYFYLGRYKGRSILLKHPEWHGRSEKIHHWLGRHQDLLIVCSRFMYGFRTIIPIILGTSKVSGIRFFTLNFSGAVVWAFIFALGGYTFGDAIERFLGKAKQFEVAIIIGIIFVTILIQVIAWQRRRRNRAEVLAHKDSAK